MSWSTYALVLIAFIAIDLLVTQWGRKAKRAYAQGPNPEYRYCPLCSYPLTKKMVGDHLRSTCEDCGFVHWNNPKPVTVTLVPKGDGLVLIKRKVEPRPGMWALPGGFMEEGESVEQGACREVKEETGLDVEIDRIVASFTTKKGLNQVLFLCLAKPVTGTPSPSDDALDAQVFSKNEVPEDIAFPLHQAAIERYFAGTLPGAQSATTAERA